MHVKMLAACASLLAFVALAIAPAMASASPELLDSGGKTVATKTTVTGFSNNLVFSTSAGNLECAEAHLEGPVTVNSGTHILGEITKAAFRQTTSNEECKTGIIGPSFQPLTATITPEGLPWCLTSSVLPNWSLSSCKGAAIQFTAHLRDAFFGDVATCVYTRTSVTGTYNTKSSPLVLKVGASQTFKSSSGGLCPETGTLSGSFTLTSGGKALSIS